jgi:hypothetical protein
VGASHTLPSFAHDEARTISHAVLRTVLPAEDLVVDEPAVLWNPRDPRRHLVPDLMVALGESLVSICIVAPLDGRRDGTLGGGHAN